MCVYLCVRVYVHCELLPNHTHSISTQKLLVHKGPLLFPALNRRNAAFIPICVIVPCGYVSQVVSCSLTYLLTYLPT
jgi:hypothetical protein